MKSPSGDPPAAHTIYEVESEVGSPFEYIKFINALSGVFVVKLDAS
jgi:hypothetical protein